MTRSFFFLFFFYVNNWKSWRILLSVLYHAGPRQKRISRSDASWVPVWIRLAWAGQTGSYGTAAVAWSQCFLRGTMLTRSLVRFHLQHRAWSMHMSREGRCEVLKCYPAQQGQISHFGLANGCLYSFSQLALRDRKWFICIFHLYGGTINRWCWCPSGNVDRIAF